MSTSPAVVCVDFGSTFTKAMLVETTTGVLLASASHRTTVETDVMEGFAACLEQLGAVDQRARDAQVLACSSAGGGLRIAVIGNEELVTAEAGRRVALSSGGKVVAVVAMAAGHDPAEALRDAQPDVVLLTGGTDGGNAEPLVAAARALVEGAWQGPVVVAGNTAARPRVAEVLAGRPHLMADNVVPRIGVLAPDSARAAIREIFLAHVIGGKHLSADPAFAEMVRGATPDVVLLGVEVLAGLVGDVVVVDVGGATTDVHSVVAVDPDTALTEDGLARDVVAPTPVTRTVEGDLGMRWSAETTVDEGAAAGLIEPTAALREAARRRREHPGLLPEDPTEQAYDVTLAAAAVEVALRRHAGRARVVLGPDGRVLERTGVDLRGVDLLVGSGGVLRSVPQAAALLHRLAGGTAGDWQLPESAEVVIDRGAVLAAMGLLARSDPGAARGLARQLRAGRPSGLSRGSASPAVT